MPWFETENCLDSGSGSTRVNARCTSCRRAGREGRGGSRWGGTRTLAWKRRASRPPRPSIGSRGARSRSPRSRCRLPSPRWRIWWNAISAFMWRAIAARRRRKVIAMWWTSTSCQRWGRCWSATWRAGADVAALHQALDAKPRTANRTVKILSKMFKLAEGWNLAPAGRNPCQLVSCFKEEPRERFLSADERRTQGRVLREAEADGSVWPRAIAALRLLMLTGCRRQEIVTLRLRHAKTGPRTANGISLGRRDFDAALSAAAVI